MSPDPYDGSYTPGNPQSFNRYSYALNNPVSYFDPSGGNCIKVATGDGNYEQVDMGDDGYAPTDPGSQDGTPCDVYDQNGNGYTLNPNGGITAGDGEVVNVSDTDSGSLGFSDSTGGYFSGGGSGGGLSDSPTRSRCAAQALGSDGNGVSLALDVAGIGAGFLPGGGLVTGSASAARTAFAVQAGLTAASTVTSVAYKSGPGIIAGILGGQVALTSKLAESIAVDVGKSIPVVGVAVSAGALLYDGYQTYQAYSGCLTGGHE